MSNSSPLPEKIWPGVTGVESAMGVPETIDLALRLHPDTQAVAIISKAAGPNSFWFQAEHSELLRHRDKIREIDLLGPARPELLQTVGELPPHTVILFQLYPEDADQPAFGALDVLAAVAERFPTYSILPHITVGRGGVGGASYDPTTDADLAGQLAARVLSGEKVDNIPVLQNSKALISVDWRQLRPMEHRRVGFAARGPDLIPRTHSLGAGQEILPCWDCCNCPAVHADLCLVLASGAPAQGRNRTWKIGTKIFESLSKKSSGSDDYEHKRRSVH